MSHGAFDDAATSLPGGAHERPMVPRPESRNPLEHALYHLNRGVLVLSMIALVLAALVLSYSVVVRYLFKTPTDWIHGIQGHQHQLPSMD